MHFINNISLKKHAFFVKKINGINTPEYKEIFLSYMYLLANQNNKAR